MNCDIRELTKNLKFNFNYLLDKREIPDWAKRRLFYHLKMETTLDQILFFTILLYEVNCSKLNIAFLCPDMHPATHNARLAALECSYDKAKNMKLLDYNLTKLQRKVEDIHAQTHLSISQLSDWASPNCFKSFDLIIIFISNYSFQVMNAILRKQNDYQNVVFFPVCDGMPIQRFKNLLSSDLVMVPRVDYKMIHSMDTSLLNHSFELDMSNMDRILDIFDSGF
jgi:hypothetical protein